MDFKRTIAALDKLIDICKGGPGSGPRPGGGGAPRYGTGQTPFGGRESKEDILNHHATLEDMHREHASNLHNWGDLAGANLHRHAANLHARALAAHVRGDARSNTVSTHANNASRKAGENPWEAVQDGKFRGNGGDD